MTNPGFTPPAGSTTGPAAVTRPLTAQAVRRRRSVLTLLGVIVLTGAVTGLWTLVARQQLAASLVAEAEDHLGASSKAFAIAIERRQAEMQSHCRVLVEDPRLKATLATEGMDEATVADILGDLAKLRGTGFLMVLSPEGRVFAQAGASELRGLDLSTSGVVKKARTARGAVAGSWVLAGRVMDLSIMAVRYGDEIIAFLVVGQAIDATVMQAVAAQTGVQVANALGGTIVQASSADPQVAAVLTRVAADPGSFDGRVQTIDGATYVTAVVQLGDSAQSHRLVLARPLAVVERAFARLEWMFLVPPVLVLIAVLFSMSVFRRTP